MSWSISREGDETEVAEAIAHDQQVPSGIKDIMLEGVEALTKRYGTGLKIRVTGHGHTFNGEHGWHDITSGTFEVKQVIS
jgi:hypothetical protein